MNEVADDEDNLDGLQLPFIEWEQESQIWPMALTVGAAPGVAVQTLKMQLAFSLRKTEHASAALWTSFSPQHLLPS